MNKRTAKLAWTRRTFTSLPRIVRAGFTLLGAGILADAGYHLFHGLHSAHGHGAGMNVPTAIHLLVAAGMTVTLAGLLQAGIRSARMPTKDKEAI